MRALIVVLPKQDFRPADPGLVVPICPVPGTDRPAINLLMQLVLSGYDVRKDARVHVAAGEHNRCFAVFAIYLA